MASAPNDIPGEDFLKVEEVAAKLRVSKMTVYRALNAGVLKGIRVGRSYRIAQSAYTEYVGSLGQSAARQKTSK